MCGDVCEGGMWVGVGVGVGLGLVLGVGGVDVGLFVVGMFWICGEGCGRSVGRGGE